MRVEAAVVLLVMALSACAACAKLCSATTLEGIAAYPDCTDATVVMRDYVSPPGPHDWSAFHTLILIGSNATILGNQNRAASKRFIVDGITFSGATSQKHYLVSSNNNDVFPDVFVVKNCLFDGASGVSIVADDNTIMMFAKNNNIVGQHLNEF